MDHFNYRDGELYAEDVPVSAIADRFGTPAYVYSRATLERHYRAYDDALRDHPHLVCYAVKANSNLAVLNVLARLGAGFDIVSAGELERVLRAGGDPSRVVFSGVGKQEWEMKRALEVGVRCFNVESNTELDRLNAVAGELGVKAPVSLRVNPDVDAGTHPYISTGLKENKFGIDIAEAPEVYARAASMPNLEVKGVDCLIGSQLTSVSPFLDALDRVLALLDELKLAGNTVVIFTSDHGYNLGDHGTWFKGNAHWVRKPLPPRKWKNIPPRRRPNMWDTSLKVPCAIRWPGVIKPGTRLSQTISNLDWFPTLLAMAKVKLPASITVRGRDFTPLLRGRVVPWNNELYAEYSMHHGAITHMRVWRTPSWKYMKDFASPGRE